MLRPEKLTVIALAVAASSAIVFSACDEINPSDDGNTAVALDAPSLDISSESISSDRFTLTWEAVENADYYNCRLDGGASKAVTDCTMTFENLAADRTYKAEVQACSYAVSQFAASQWSSATVKTLPSSGKPDPTPDPPVTDPSDIPEGYTLVWADEFNGASLDMTAWNIEVNGNGGGNNELQYYREENVSISDEPTTGRRCLTLTARRESYGGKSATSGRINSQGKKFFKYGRYDALIKFPSTANGLWPAYWMMGNDITENQWPKCGEIDIVEMGHAEGIRNGSQDRYFNGACHWGFYKDVGGGNWAYPNYAKSSTWGYSLQDTFHLFTLVWDEQNLRMYVDMDKYPDAEPYFEMGITDTSDDWSTGNYFHKECFILFNLAVGGNFPAIWNIDGITALAAGEAKMYVDYVRVYQKKR